MLRLLQVCLAAIVAVCVVGVARPQAAADTWLEVKGAHFTVVTNASERKARNILWQFEQIRAAITKGWSWANVGLQKPVLVIGAKDETTMRALAPMYWERRGETRPSSVFVTGADRNYIALRADLEVEAQGMNPYNQAFSANSMLVLQQSFRRGLPLWLLNGMSAMLGNTIVDDKDIQFGKPIPWLVETLRTAPRLALSEFLTVAQDSPYYRQDETRRRFDAQSWAIVQYLLFGRRDNGEGFRQLTQLIIEGSPSDAAFRAVYGSLEAVEEAYLRYVHQGAFTFGRLQVESDTSPAKVPSRAMTPAEHAAVRAQWHVSMNRPAEARALMAEARKADATLAAIDDAEGMLLDREQQAEGARSAFARAVAAGSTNFWTHYRLASLMATSAAGSADMRAEILTRLERATALNADFAPGFSYLANLQLAARQWAQALTSAERAVTLEPTSVTHRLAVARALLGQGRNADAEAAVRQAAPLVRTEQERAALDGILRTITARAPVAP